MWIAWAAACAMGMAWASDEAARAYRALESRDYDAAIELFQTALAASPERKDWRRQLAYTLLKAGETEAARDQFADVIARDPNDAHTALEYAFLCHETGRSREARLLFQKLRGSADARIRATAEQAFGNVDGPLEAAIGRWRRALAANPGDFSAHVELARAAELRNDAATAALHYRKGWELKPAERGVLVDYGRAAKLAGDDAAANAAFLAASRSDSPRAAEMAADQLPERYPYADEFRSAIRLDPSNIGLRREFGFLLLALGQSAQAEEEFAQLLAISPDDLLACAQLGLLLLARNQLDRAMPLLEKVMKGGDAKLSQRVREALNGRDWKSMGAQAYDAGRLQDALRFYLTAYKQDPADPEIPLKIGYSYNMLKQDQQALVYFRMARGAQDPAVRQEASRAVRNLSGDTRRFRTSYWTLPVYSSRWSEMFTYGQVKTELRLGKAPVRPYGFVRFVGDSQRGAGPLGPGYLSESSFIVGMGVAGQVWRQLTAWSEAGSAVRYRRRNDIGRMTPDYRGGLSYGRGWGAPIQSEEPGLFWESHNDAVYLSRFQWNLLAYTQNSIGRTMRPIGDFHWRLAWNMNLTMDRKREPWANFVDIGPGLRFRHKRMPPSMVWFVDFLRGGYLIQEGNPRKPIYYDVRIGVWYAGMR